MTDEYIKIAWSDVQPGDILMHENGDRHEVTGVEVDCCRWIQTRATNLSDDQWRSLGFSPHRPVPPIPTEIGPYLDKDGVLCDMRSRTGVWKDTTTDHFHSSEYMRSRAPFTRLVPMPTEADVRTAIDSSRISSGFLTDEATAAVMSLFSTEVE